MACMVEGLARAAAGAAAVGGLTGRCRAGHGAEKHDALTGQRSVRMAGGYIKVSLVGNLDLLYWGGDE